MVFTESKDENRLKCNYEEALTQTGFGKYNILMLLSCCLLILAMYLDIFGLSVVLPAIACDMDFSTTQLGVISAAPLIGVMCSSYFWGLCADTQGRRRAILVAMPIGVTLNVVTAFAPNFTAIVALKFFSGCFTSSANAAGFVLLGESFPVRQRSRGMFILASATMFSQLLSCIFVLPIYQLTFRFPISWLSIEFRPWRLLALMISLPGVIGIIMMLFLCESPKYLLSKDKNEQCLEVLKHIYSQNTRSKKSSFQVQAVCLERTEAPPEVSLSILSKIWNQTAPLFKPPLLMNSLKLYFILLCAYMTSTGFTMWVPTMTNTYFNADDANGKTFCEVASTAASARNTKSMDCDNVIQSSTLYAVMCYSAGGGILITILSFFVGFTGKRNMTIGVFVMSATAGVALLFVTTPLLSITLFCFFLWVAAILGNINTYLVELNPTHLRGMATCLSVVVARGFGFISVQLIGALLANHCVPMIIGYIVLVIIGLICAIFLPAEAPKQKAVDDVNLESKGNNEKI